MTGKLSKEFMSTNRQSWSIRRPKESAERVSDGRSAQKDNGKINRERRCTVKEGGGWRAHATVKCISGGTHPVRWNWTLWKNIVLGQAESGSLGSLLGRGMQTQEENGTWVSSISMENTDLTHIRRKFYETVAMFTRTNCAAGCDAVTTFKTSHESRSGWNPQEQWKKLSNK